MKKILLVGLTLISSITFAQVEKGDITATGNVSWTNMKFKDVDDPFTLTNFSARGGYFFTNNVEAGISLSVSGTSVAGESSSTFGFGPYAVYNFLTADGKMLPYLGANFYSSSTTDQDAINQLGAFGGAKYFLTEVVNIDANLNYTSWLGDIKGSSLIFNIGVGINFGKLK